MKKFLKRMTFKPGLHTHSSTSNQFHPKVIKDTFRTYFFNNNFRLNKKNLLKINIYIF